jgi:hypothetical protein
MMTPDDYATTAETLLNQVVHRDSSDPVLDAQAAHAYAFLAVASALDQIAEQIEAARPS